MKNVNYLMVNYSDVFLYLLILENIVRVSLPIKFDHVHHIYFTFCNNAALLLVLKNVVDVLLKAPLHNG